MRLTAAWGLQLRDPDLAQQRRCRLPVRLSFPLARAARGAAAGGRGGLGRAQPWRRRKGREGQGRAGESEKETRCG
eukprot:1563183-Pyramimonas_sp.AAC.1